MIIPFLIFSFGLIVILSVLLWEALTMIFSVTTSALVTVLIMLAVAVLFNSSCYLLNFLERHSGEGRNPVSEERLKVLFKRYVFWIPAFAGMTVIGGNLGYLLSLIGLQIMTTTKKTVKRKLR